MKALSMKRSRTFLLVSCLFGIFATSTLITPSFAEPITIEQRKQARPIQARILKLIKKGAYEEALTQANQVLRQNDKNLQVRFMRTVIYEKLARTEDAEKELRDIIHKYPEVPEPYNNLAVILAAKGQYERAKNFLQKVLTIDPRFALARKNLGDIYLALAHECYVVAAPDLSNDVVNQRLKTLDRLLRNE